MVGFRPSQNRVFLVRAVSAQSPGQHLQFHRPYYRAHGRLRLNLGRATTRSSVEDVAFDLPTASWRNLDDPVTDLIHSLADDLIGSNKGGGSEVNNLVNEWLIARTTTTSTPTSPPRSGASLPSFSLLADTACVSRPPHARQPRKLRQLTLHLLLHHHLLHCLSGALANIGLVGS